MKAAKRIESPPDYPEPVKGHCPRCAKPIAMRLKHYETVRCNCGLMLWTLRPERHGPLQIYRHPGLPEGHYWLNKGE
jgi:hypothetical protein